MTSVYLQPSDCAAFGVPAATAAQITYASMLIDTYLQRPEGLVWAPDGAGAPCDMVALSPSLSFTLTTGIAAGVNVVAELQGPAAMLQPGDVVIFDRASKALKEAATVASVAGQAVTFRSIASAHSSGATVDLGLVIEEQRYLPDSRPITFVARTPVVRIHSGVGRYAYGRRGDSSNYNMEQFNLLAAVSKFGGPPAWEWFDPLNTGVDAQTGQVWIPAGVMLAYYSEVKLRFVAGYAQSNLPSAIKQACASLVTALASSPLVGNAKTMKAGDSAIERFTASNMSIETKALLDPFCVRAFV